MSQYSSALLNVVFLGVLTPITNADQLPTNPPASGFQIVIGNSNIIDPITSQTLLANNVYFWFDNGYELIGGTGGSGSVSSVSAGNLSPLFITSVANPTTTPDISFTLGAQTANTIFAGPSSGSAAAPTFRGLVSADLPIISDGSILGNTSGSSAAPVSTTLTHLLDYDFGSTQGSVLYRNVSNWTILSPGSSGQVLTSGGPSANISWTTASGTGNVIGPVSSTTHGLVSYANTSGKQLEAISTIVVSANNTLTGAVGSDFIFQTPSTGTPNAISLNAGSCNSGNNNGANINIISGAGNGTGDGGTITIQAGNGDGSNSGNNVLITAGSSTNSTSSTGSNVNITGGKVPATSTTNQCGNIIISAGLMNGTGGSSSTEAPYVLIEGGDAPDVGIGGLVELLGGNGGTTSASPSDSGGGSIQIRGGSALSGDNNGGNIALIGGSGFGGGGQGWIDAFGLLKLHAGYGIYFPPLSSGAGLSGTGTLDVTGQCIINTSDCTASSIPIAIGQSSNGVLQTNTVISGSFKVVSTAGASDSGRTFYWVLLNSNT